MGFFFKNKDQKAMLAACDVVEHKLGDCLGLLDEIRQYVKAEGKLMSEVVAIGGEPLQVVLAQLQKRSYERLTSGIYHIYRGELSGTGHRLEAICNAAMEELLKHGFIDDDAIREVRENMRVEIEVMG